MPSGAINSSSSIVSLQHGSDVTGNDAAMPDPTTKLKRSCLVIVSAFICNCNVYSPTDNEIIKQFYCRRRRRRRQHQQLYTNVTEGMDKNISRGGEMSGKEYASSNTISKGKINTSTKHQRYGKNWSCSYLGINRLLIYFLLLVLLLTNSSCTAQQLDCCLPENTEDGMGCTAEGTEIGGEKYLCVSINSDDCVYCNKRSNIDVSQCATGCVVAKLRYFCSGRYDPSTRHAVFGSRAVAQHAAEIAQNPLGDMQLPQLRGTLMTESKTYQEYS